MIKRLIQSKSARNATWLISGKIIQKVISLFVGVLTVRYLNPANYGLVNYGMAYVGFFMHLCTLGINSIIIKDFFDHPHEQGLAIGSTLVLKALSSFCSAIMIISIVSVLDYNEPLTIAVVTLCSISLLFHVFDTFNYWFQSQYKSKITAISTLIAYIATSIYRIILLALNANVLWFAFAFSVDYIVLGLVLIFAYKTNNGPKLRFSWSKGKYLLSTSYHYILSGMMIAIYEQTDKLMLKQMLNDEAVGYYSTAATLCAMWTFVLFSIIDSIYPSIMQLHKQSNYPQFERKNKQLYAIIIYSSFIVSILFCLFGDYAILVLYGAKYAPAATPLKILTWCTTFTFLGIARNAWIVCEGKQRYLKSIYFTAALLNIPLNIIFIPIWGPTGAAFASLVTQLCSSVILPLFIKDLRKNTILILDAAFLKGVFNSKIE